MKKGKIDDKRKKDKRKKEWIKKERKDTKFKKMEEQRKSTNQPICSKNIFP